MKLDKAIEILEEHVTWCDEVKEIDTYNALKLGIEALKHIQAWRNNRPHDPYIKLPSETKD